MNLIISYTGLGRRVSYEKLIRAPLIKAPLAKTSGTQRPPEEIDAAIRQLVSKAIMAGEGIIDVFTAAGLKKKEVMVRRILKMHGYPPDLQEEATNTVLTQVELLSAIWALSSQMEYLFRDSLNLLAA